MIAVVCMYYRSKYVHWEHILCQSIAVTEVFKIKVNIACGHVRHAMLNRALCHLRSVQSVCNSTVCVDVHV